MRLYLQGSKAESIFRTNQPAVLRERELLALDKFGKECGLESISGAEGIVTVRLLRHASLASVLEYLHYAEIACVDLEIADLIPLLGDSVITSALVTTLSRKPRDIEKAKALQARLDNLIAVPTDEILPTLDALQWSTFDADADANLSEEQMVENMRKAGIKVDDPFPAPRPERIPDLPPDWIAREEQPAEPRRENDGILELE